MQRVPHARHGALAVGGIYASRCKRIAAVTLASILDAEVGVSGTGRSAFLQRHVIRSHRLVAQSSTGGRFRVAAHIRKAPDDGRSDRTRLTWSRARGRRRGHRGRSGSRARRQGVNVEAVSSAAEFASIAGTHHVAVSNWGCDRTLSKRRPTVALGAILGTGICVACAGRSAVGHRVEFAQVLDHRQGPSARGLGVTAQALPPIYAWVDNRSGRGVAVDHGRVGEQ